MCNKIIMILVETMLTVWQKFFCKSNLSRIVWKALIKNDWFDWYERLFFKRHSLLTLSFLSISSTFFIMIAANGTKMPSKNFVFKCHRDGSNVHSVNSIDFHHYGSFCTAGSDGTFSWWDKEARCVLMRTCDYIILVII